ncbi:MAG: MFS transporter [Candidatus Falkowbacteria bacterium]
MNINNRYIGTILTKLQNWRIAIYTMHAVDGMAGSLIGIFIPIYFLSLGYSVAQIFIFFIINNLLILLFFFVAGWVAQRFGLLQTLVMRLIFLLINLVLLYYLKNQPSFFYFISALSAIELALYWFPLHVVFAKSSELDTMGKHVGSLFALPSLVGLFIPLIGAGITAWLGFSALFLFAGIIYLISIIPVIFMAKIPIVVNINFDRILTYLRNYKKYFVAEFFQGISSEVEGYILPIFLFLTFNDILTIGFIGTFLSLGSAIFTLFIGKLSDKIDRKQMLRAGALAMILIWVGRYFSINQISFFMLSIASGFLGALISVPFNSIFYINAKKSDVEDFVIFREIPISLGRVVLYSTGLLLVSQVKITFLFSMAAYLFMLIF